MSEKLLIDAEITPVHVADEAVGVESAFMNGINGMTGGYSQVVAQAWLRLD
jgi:hypothetical protein